MSSFLRHGRLAFTRIEARARIDREYGKATTCLRTVAHFWSEIMVRARLFRSRITCANSCRSIFLIAIICEANSRAKFMTHFVILEKIIFKHVMGRRMIYENVSVCIKKEMPFLNIYIYIYMSWNLSICSISACRPIHKVMIHSFNFQMHIDKRFK